jgi:drug/metabolite transporter (DMT)-like permease
MTTEAREGGARPRPVPIPGGLWLALLVPPVGWLVNLEVTYALAGGVCEGDPLWPLLASTMLAALATAACIVYAQRLWRREGRGDGPRRTGRQPLRFLLVGAMAMGAYFLLVILASFVPQIVRPGCP